MASGEESKAQTWASIFHELYIDFLSSLVPGLFMVILGAGMVMLAICTLYFLIWGKDAPSAEITEQLKSLKEVLVELHYAFAIIMLVSSYVIGSVFFRQDPKGPDILSARYVWLKSKREDRPGLAMQYARPDRNGVPDTTPIEEIDVDHSALRWLYLLFPRLYERWHDTGPFDAQFPYWYMRCYLAARGLTHLMKYIPWCPKLPDTKGNRTKMFINILKIRVSCLASRFGRDIVRNEAHVRLATSVWYATTTLFYLGLGCVLILVIAYLYVLFALHTAPLLKYYFASSVFISIVVVLCVIMKRHLLKCIHYMRVREVVYVLETAHLASQATPSFHVEELIEKDINERHATLDPQMCTTCERCRPKTSATTVTSSRG
jgi:hypothetical protein